MSEDPFKNHGEPMETEESPQDQGNPNGVQQKNAVKPNNDDKKLDLERGEADEVGDGAGRNPLPGTQQQMLDEKAEEQLKQLLEKELKLGMDRALKKFKFLMNELFKQGLGYTDVQVIEHHRVRKEWVLEAFNTLYAALKENPELEEMLQRHSEKLRASIDSQRVVFVRKQEIMLEKVVMNVKIATSVAEDFYDDRMKAATPETYVSLRDESTQAAYEKFKELLREENVEYHPSWEHELARKLNDKKIPPGFEKRAEPEVPGSPPGDEPDLNLQPPQLTTRQGVVPSQVEEPSVNNEDALALASQVHGIIPVIGDHSDKIQDPLTDNLDEPRGKVQEQTPVVVAEAQSLNDNNEPSPDIGNKPSGESPRNHQGQAGAPVRFETAPARMHGGNPSATVDGAHELTQVLPNEPAPEVRYKKQTSVEKPIDGVTKKKPIKLSKKLRLGVYIDPTSVFIGTCDVNSKQTTILCRRIPKIDVREVKFLETDVEGSLDVCGELLSPASTEESKVLLLIEAIRNAVDHLEDGVERIVLTSPFQMTDDQLSVFAHASAAASVELTVVPFASATIYGASNRVGMRNSLPAKAETYDVIFCTEKVLNQITVLVSNKAVSRVKKHTVRTLSAESSTIGTELLSIIDTSNGSRSHFVELENPLSAALSFEMLHGSFVFTPLTTEEGPFRGVAYYSQFDKDVFNMGPF